MAHVLVKWVTQDKWDVYPIRCMTDTQTALRLTADATLLDSLEGKPFDIVWAPNEDPSPAYILGLGKFPLSLFVCIDYLEAGHITGTFIYKHFILLQS